MKRFITASLLAWLVFIGIDFFFHASLLQSLWEGEIDAFKSLNQLAILIPVGYGSFLLLTLLLGYLFSKIFPEKPKPKAFWEFSLTFGFLFCMSNLMGMYSYLNIPLSYLLVFQLVYFFEILAVSYTFQQVLFSAHPRKVAWKALTVFFMLILGGILLQNTL